MVRLGLLPRLCLPWCVSLAAIGCAGDGTGLDEFGNPILVSAGVEITPDDVAFPVGVAVQLAANSFDAAGNPITGDTVVWSSSDPTIVSVDQTGLATANAPGATTVRAASDGAVGTATMIVVATAQFTNQVQPIFNASCAFTGCHAGAQPQVGQDLSVGNAFDNIVSVSSVELSTMFRVTPGDPAQSYLVHKIRGTQADVGGSGVQMPRGAGPLPNAEIDIIRAWVQAGAPNN